MRLKGECQTKESRDFGVWWYEAASMLCVRCVECGLPASHSNAICRHHSHESGLCVRGFHADQDVCIATRRTQTQDDAEMKQTSGQQTPGTRDQLLGSCYYERPQPREVGPKEAAMLSSGARVANENSALAADRGRSNRTLSHARTATGQAFLAGSCSPTLPFCVVPLVPAASSTALLRSRRAWRAVM